ncbi:hypothetical protein [Aminobacter aminovorans]|uniref:Uncharacterized protein n=1 Tax=Aminobacter aminovorans TaxID=83263 RepID=A0ABR6H305_AMIAI|nr:hypothetical protein [Aminobacter aminovorans]MBB3704888.1 hypothetical protein [Aminobacter aminovorans]
MPARKLLRCIMIRTRHQAAHDREARAVMVQQWQLIVDLHRVEQFGVDAVDTHGGAGESVALGIGVIQIDDAALGTLAL